MRLGGRIRIDLLVWLMNWIPGFIELRLLDKEKQSSHFVHIWLFRPGPARVCPELEQPVDF
jgi:hypothetical protein